MRMGIDMGKGEAMTAEVLIDLRSEQIVAIRYGSGALTQEDVDAVRQGRACYWPPYETDEDD